MCVCTVYVHVHVCGCRQAHYSTHVEAPSVILVFCLVWDPSDVCEPGPCIERLSCVCLSSPCTDGGITGLLLHREPTADQSADPIQVQLEEPVSFIEGAYRNVGYLQEQKWCKVVSPEPLHHVWQCTAQWHSEGESALSGLLGWLSLFQAVQPLLISSTV